MARSRSSGSDGTPIVAVVHTSTGPKRVEIDDATPEQRSRIGSWFSTGAGYALDTGDTTEVERLASEPVGTRKQHTLEYDLDNIGQAEDEGLLQDGPYPWRDGK